MAKHLKKYTSMYLFSNKYKTINLDVTHIDKLFRVSTYVSSLSMEQFKLEQGISILYSLVEVVYAER